MKIAWSKRTFAVAVATLAAVVGSAAMALAKPAPPPPPPAPDRVEIQAKVNEAICAAGAVQCNDEGSGHGHEAASDANHNPVQIVALVTRNGAPVTGLAATSFFLNNHVLVPGGPVALLCPHGGTGCGGGAHNLFQAHPDGTYVLFAHPGPVAVNWRAGSAFATLQVVLPGGLQAHTLVRIEIPARPAIPTAP